MIKTKTTGWLLILILAFQLPASAQKLDKYYTRRVQENGDLFFVFPNEDFKNRDDRSDFLFDVTMRQGHDTVNINFTYFRDEALPADFLQIKSGDQDLKLPAQKIFIDFDKNEWTQRFGAHLTYTQFKKIINNPEPPEFVVWAGDKKLTYTTRSGKWDKYTEALKKILYIYETD